MRKVLNKRAALFAVCFSAVTLGVPAAQAQMIDDKMMPPTLIVPPQQTQESYDPAQAAEQLFSDDGEGGEAPISVYEVPIIDVPQDDSEADAQKPMRIGTFSMLHKVTAKVREIELPVGEEVVVGELTLLMHDCLTAPPEEPPETRSFLQISEFKHGADRLLFSGWMFASSPAIHALEHPVFDLWPLACKTADGLPYTGEDLPPAVSSSGLSGGVPIRR